MAGNDELQVAHRFRIDGQYEEAIAHYRRILAAQADNAEAFWGLGLSLMNIGEFDEALEMLARAAELRPDNARFLLDLGKLQTMLGMYDEAKPIFEKVVAIAPNTREGEDAANQLRYY